MSAEHAHAPSVIDERRGHLGVLTLNRPAAINALTHEMVTLIDAALDEWERDDSVAAVMLRGNGERGLCAGGDVVELYRDATAGDGRASARFLRDEYRLNARIANFAKPFVAIMRGIVLGGGIGLSAHASHRVVTDSSKLGMPETGIGFVPDVGGTWLLSHAPGELGTYLALTAGSVGPGDGILLGLADTFVRVDRLDELERRLESEHVDAAIAAVAAEPPEARLASKRAWIDDAFAGDSVAGIMARLRAKPGEEQGDAADLMVANSPTALVVTLEALRRAASFDQLEEALVQEYRLGTRLHGSHDFVEGVRARVIDKDRHPQWQPATLEEVSADSVAAYFAALDDDLTFFTRVADAVVVTNPEI